MSTVKQAIKERYNYRFASTVGSWIVEIIKIYTKGGVLLANPAEVVEQSPQFQTRQGAEDWAHRKLFVLNGENGE